MINNFGLGILCVFHLFLLLIVIFFRQKLDRLYEKVERKKETFQDAYQGREEQYTRIPLPKYVFEEKGDGGKLEIENFMLQWGNSSSESVNFPFSFKNIYGIFACPSRGGGGKESIFVRDVDKQKAVFKASSEERPFYWFAIGSVEKEE